MTTWFELHAEVYWHPKTVKAANALTRGDCEKMVGHLGRLWSWAIDNAPEGDLTHLRARQIADAAGWRGNAESFVSTLLEVRFLDAGPRIHDWHDYAGRLIERRRHDSERKRAERAASAGLSGGHPLDSPMDVRKKSGGTVPNRTGPLGPRTSYGRTTRGREPGLHAIGDSVRQAAADAGEST